MAKRDSSPKPGGHDLAQREIAKILKHRQEATYNRTERNVALICMYYPQYRIEDVLNMSIGNFRLLISAIQAQKLEELENQILAANCVMNPKGAKKINQQLTKLHRKLGD